MDPEITLQRAESAAADSNVTEVVECLANLCIWLASGGFQPKRLHARLDAIVNGEDR